MRNLFCTADKIGTETGGGVVTLNELKALEDFARAAKEEEVLCFDGSNLDPSHVRLPNNPYVQDYIADSLVLNHMQAGKFKLAHFYSGMFSKTIWRLKADGAKITQTIAAHDMQLSAEEFAKYGMAYDFPHLVNRTLFMTYVEGQLMADKVICPSTQSAEIVKRYGVRDPIVIPHGIPGPIGTPAPLPQKFTVGYLGQCGPDKGLRYLLEAWSKLNLPNCRLVMAGRGIEQMAPVWQSVGGRGEVEFLGWVKDVNAFYDSISVYVQPSVTEGFGIEVLEAMARGRPVIVSDGAGASNVISQGADGYVFPKRDVNALCETIQQAYNWFTYEPAPDETSHGDVFLAMAQQAQETAKKYTWDKIWPQYQAVWQSLLGSKFELKEPAKAKCYSCFGLGACPICKGRTDKCDVCHGAGVCPDCKGEGELLA
jgi:glycosyltransferase involved in cell wall biosynthesis